MMGGGGYDPAAAALDAAARKKLPSWIREGLEKMEREKQKKAELEERARMREEKLRLRREEEERLEREGGGDPTRSKFDSMGSSDDNDSDEELDRVAANRQPYDVLFGDVQMDDDPIGRVDHHFMGMI